MHQDRIRSGLLAFLQKNHLKYIPLNLFPDGELTEEGDKFCTKLGIVKEELVDITLNDFRRSPREPIEVVELRYNHHQNRRRRHLQILAKAMKHQFNRETIANKRFSLLSKELLSQRDQIDSPKQLTLHNLDPSFTSSYRRISVLSRPSAMHHVVNTASSVDENRGVGNLLLTEIPLINFQQRHPSQLNHAPMFPGTTKNIGQVTFINKEQIKIIRTANNSLNSSQVHLLPTSEEKDAKRIEKLQKVQENLNKKIEEEEGKISQILMKQQLQEKQLNDIRNKRLRQERKKKQEIETKRQEALTNFKEKLKELDNESFRKFKEEIQERQENNNSFELKKSPSNNYDIMKVKLTKEQEEMQRKKEKQVEQERQINLYLEQIENKISQSKAKRREKLEENSQRAAKYSSGVREVQRAHSQSIEQLLTHNQEQLMIKKQQILKNESRRIKGIEGKTKRIQEMFNNSIERVRIGREESMREKSMKTQDLIYKYGQKEKLIEEIKQQQQHQILIKKELHNLKMQEISSNLNKKHAQLNETKSRALQKLEKMEQIQNSLKEQQKQHEKERIKIQAYEQQIIHSIIPKFKRQHRRTRVISEPVSNGDFDTFKTQEEAMMTTFQKTIY